MNIFYLNHSEAESAKALCDKHVVKMIVESTQLLCNAYPENSFPEQYKRTHYNHPCSIWTRDNIYNFNWLLEYALELCKEYTHRYYKVHKCYIFLCYMCSNLPELSDSSSWTVPPQVMPDEFKVKGNTVKAYRNYYHHKAETMKSFCYTNRTPPDWLYSNKVKCKIN